MRIFVSYNRDSEAIARALVADLEKLGHSVWFDRELSGGQAWWERILAEIRDCRLLVFLLSPKALDSVACTRERGYALALGKAVLPLQVADGVSVNLLPPDIAHLQIIRYRGGDRDEVMDLARALAAVPVAPPLPSPLPAVPEVPSSYLGTLALRIDDIGAMSYEEQSALLIDLRQELLEADSRADAEVLLDRLRKRRDLFAAIAREIDALREPTQPPPVGKRSVPPPAPAPGPAPGPVAPVLLPVPAAELSWRDGRLFAGIGLGLGAVSLVQLYLDHRASTLVVAIPLLLVWPTAAGLVSGWLAARDRRATWLAAVLAACGFLGWLGTGERDWLAVGVAYGIAPGALIGAALGWWLRRRRTH
jgi:hypothetical protein